MEHNATEAIYTIQQFSSQLKCVVLLHDLDSIPSPEGFILNTINIIPETDSQIQFCHDLPSYPSHQWHLSAHEPSYWCHHK